MAVLLTFELTSRHLEVREKMLKMGFLNSMVGFDTAYPGGLIQSDLPSTLLFHESFDGADALSALRRAANSCGIQIDDREQRAFAIEVEERGAVGWRGIISRVHPNDKP